MVTAQYFDGKSAAAQAVELSLSGQELQLRGADFELHWPLRGVNVSERLGNTPRRLTFADGGHCEVSDVAALDGLLAAAGHRGGWLGHLQHSLRWALFAAVLFIVIFVAAYRYLLPWGAEVIALRMPDSALRQMGESTLATLDRVVLKPSTLAPARQQSLRESYSRLAPLSGARPGYRIEFRSAPRIGANAFALPDGSIVMLDQLVELTQDDNELLAVLAHERGHVEQRHTLRMALQSSVVGLVLTWYMGDVSTLLATVPAMVLEAGYSRDMEREADDYAVRTLRQNGLSPCLLGSMLGKLEAARPAPQQRKAEQGDKVMDYLASHPATAERTATLCAP